jgi:hypothetical protein
MNNRYLVSRERFIPAAPEEIFEVLATPALHRVIDGSGTAGTRVTEQWDARAVRGKFFLRLAGYLRRHPAGIEKTLLRLEQHVTGAAGLAR